MKDSENEHIRSQKKPTQQKMSRPINDRKQIETPLKSLAYHFPVDDTPEGIQVVGTAVLIVEVIGVFPNIERKQWPESVADRSIGVEHLMNAEVAVTVGAEPGPTASEKRNGRGAHLGFQLAETAETLYDSLSQRSRRPID